MNYQLLNDLVEIFQGSPADDAESAVMREFVETIDEQQLTASASIANAVGSMWRTTLDGSANRDRAVAVNTLQHALALFAKAERIAGEFIDRFGGEVPLSESAFRKSLALGIFFGFANNHPDEREGTAGPDETWPSAEDAPDFDVDEVEGSTPPCGDARCVVTPSQCTEEHPPINIEEISAWKRALLPGSEQVAEATWYVHAHHAAQVVVHGVASDAITVFRCETREACARVIAQCSRISAFHNIDIHTHPPAMSPTTLRFDAKSVFENE